MKIIIFTEAGPKYGYGHLMRCLALAQGFKAKELKVDFFIHSQGDYTTLLVDFTFKQVDWLESNKIQDILNKDQIAIVDSYYASENLCKIIYQGFKRVLFLDDYQRIEYSGGFVLNGIIGSEKLNYSKNSDITYLLGVDFQPLRQEFWDVPLYTVREKIENIMITFGGSDVTNETPFYLNKVIKYYPDAKITVVIGKGFNNINEIMEQKNKEIEFAFNTNALSMRNLMLKSDLAVSAAGQTISELARVGVPTIGIQIAENQKNNIKYWQEAGFLLTKDNIGNKLSYELRKRCSSIGKALIDGQGVKRIVEVLL